MTGPGGDPGVEIKPALLVVRQTGQTIRQRKVVKYSACGPVPKSGAANFRKVCRGPALLTNESYYVQATGYYRVKRIWYRIVPRGGMDTLDAGDHGSWTGAVP